MRVATVIGGMAVAAATLFAAPAMVGHNPVAEVRAAPASSAPQQQSPAPAESKAIREQSAERTSRNARYFRGAPAAIKNRAGGERAHRRWRKAKASGRRAA